MSLPKPDLQISERMAHVPKSGIREIFDIAQSLGDVINLGIGEPDFNTPEFIGEAAKESIDQHFTKYTPNAGVLELREAIARKLKRENGIDADPRTEIIVTAGATQAIFVAMNCILNSGDEVILPAPLFPAYKYAVRLAGGVPVEVSVDEKDGFSLDLERIEESIGPRTRILVLNSPCNPTGAVFSRKEIERLCEIAANHDLYLVSDEIYEKYLYDDATCFSPGSKEEFKNRVITVNGFAKTFAMTGWRLGYAAANSELINAMVRYNMYNSTCVTSFVQKAGVAALDSRPLSSFFPEILRQFDERRRIMCAGLAELGFEADIPKGAFYVFPKLPDYKSNSSSFSRELLSKEKVATIPGSSFGQAGEGHIRISYSLHLDKIYSALDRIKRFKKQLEA
jgi:aminotransferase